MKTKYIFIAVGFLIVSACSKLEKTRIINNCNSDIDIELHFNQDVIQFLHPKKNVQIDRINSLTEESIKNRISFDSTNFISTFKLERKDTLAFTIGIDNKKNILLFIKGLTIKKDNESIQINDYESILELMTNKDSNMTEFNLTEKIFELNE